MIEDDAETVQVARLVHLEALRLLGREIVHAAHHHTGLRHGHRLRRHGARDPKVGEFHDVEDVRRLDVAVQQPLTMRVRETAADLRGEVDRDGFGDRTVFFDHLRERRPVDELHHDKVLLAFAPHIVDVHDVRMRELRRVLRFRIEPLHEIAVGRKRFAQHFYGDAPAQHGIDARIHHGHAALPDAAFQPISLGEVTLDHASRARGPRLRR